MLAMQLCLQVFCRCLVGGGGGLMAPDAVAQSRVGRGPVSLWYVEEMVVSGRLAKIVTLSTENGSERSVT